MIGPKPKKYHSVSWQLENFIAIVVVIPELSCAHLYIFVNTMTDEFGAYICVKVLFSRSDKSTIVKKASGKPGNEARYIRYG